MEDRLEMYLTDLLPDDDLWVKSLEQNAHENFIPIMERTSMNFAMQLIRILKPKLILEVGTAIGYSALRMVQAYPEAVVVTIEQDLARYEEAIKNINNLNKQNQIKVIYGDALEEIPKLSKSEEFDLIFIDAAKGKYKLFHKLASPYLNLNGIILSDNVLFRGYIAGTKEIDPKYKNLVDKVRDYNKWLSQLSGYHTTFVPIGDGLAITMKDK